MASRKSSSQRSVFATSESRGTTATLATQGEIIKDCIYVKDGSESHDEKKIDDDFLMLPPHKIRPAPVPYPGALWPKTPRKAPRINSRKRPLEYPDEYRPAKRVHSGSSPAPLATPSGVEPHSTVKAEPKAANHLSSAPKPAGKEPDGLKNGKNLVENLEAQLALEREKVKQLFVNQIWLGKRNEAQAPARARLASASTLALVLPSDLKGKQELDKLEELKSSAEKIFAKEETAALTEEEAHDLKTLTRGIESWIARQSAALKRLVIDCLGEIEAANMEADGAFAGRQAIGELLGRVQDEYDELCGVNQSLEHHIHDMSTEIRYLREEKLELNDAHAREVVNLKEEIRLLGKAREENESLASANEHYEEVVEEKSAKIALVEDGNGKTQAAHILAAGELVEARDEIKAAYEADISRLQKEVDDIKATYVSEVTHLNKERHDIEVAHKAEVAKLQKEAAYLKVEHGVIGAKKEHMKRSMMNRIHQADMNWAAAMEETERVVAENAMLKDQMKSMQALFNDSKNDADAKQREMQQKIATLEAEKEELRKEALQKETTWKEAEAKTTAQLTTHQAEKANLLAENEATNEALARACRQVQELTTEVSNMEKVCADMDSHETEWVTKVTALQSALDQAANDHYQWQRTARIRSQEIARLRMDQQRVNFLLRNHGGLEGQAQETLFCKVNSLLEHCIGLSAELETKQAVLETAEAELAEVRAQINRDERVFSSIRDAVAKGRAIWEAGREGDSDSWEPTESGYEEVGKVEAGEEQADDHSARSTLLSDN